MHKVLFIFNPTFKRRERVSFELFSAIKFRHALDVHYVFRFIVDDDEALEPHLHIYKK